MAKIGSDRNVALVHPSSVSSMAHKTEPRAMIEPTERSMPPVRITRVMPTATIPLLETWRSTSDKLPVLRKMLTPLDEMGDERMPTASRITRLQ
jgi:hypothetical protein